MIKEVNDFSNVEKNDSFSDIRNSAEKLDLDINKLDKPLSHDLNKSPEQNEVKDKPTIKDLDKPLSKDIAGRNGSQDLKDASEKEENLSGEISEKKGGSYKEVFKEGEGDKYEVHHMPADNASNLERNDGPAIKMEKEDHRQTASCGNSKEAREYRAAQKELIDQGKFREALQMDIDDIHEKFGDKYDDAINEMLEYVDELEQEGKING